MVAIRLARHGAKKSPFYRIVATDSRNKRDGRFIEILGHYNPVGKDKPLVVKTDRVAYWIGMGARPSATVARLIELAYRCNLCRRCAQPCPIAVDNALLSREIRKIASQQMGIAPKDLHSDG